MNDLLQRLQEPFPPAAVTGNLCKCGCGQQTSVASVTRRKLGWFKGQPLPYVQGHNRKWASTTEKAFWSHVDVGESDECWIWTGKLAGVGYGKMRIAGEKAKLAHRFSYILHKGEIPNGLFVLHKCDNPKCVNPNHLFLGTHQDNMDDKVRKGRHPRGEDSRNAKLTWDQVRLIRSLYSAGQHTIRDLGRQFCVSESTVRFVVKGKTWKEAEL